MTADNRTQIEEKYKWNLSDLYASDELWEKEKGSVKIQMSGVSDFKDRLSSSGEVLSECLDFVDNIHKVMGRLSSYSGRKSDEDTRVSKYLSMQKDITNIAAEFAKMTAFIEPEIIQIAEERVREMIKDCSDLKKHSFYLLDLMRRKKHKLSEKEEQLLASASVLAQAPYDAFNVFSNAELPYPEVLLKDGRKVRLDHSGFALYRTEKDKDDREKVFSVFFSALNNFRRTFASNLYSNIQKDIFYSRTRGYESSLHHSLDDYFIPLDVYHSLIKYVHEALPVFHRYLSLRKRLLKLNDFKYSDVYAPVVADVDLRYSYEDAKKIILESLEPMGKDYCRIIKRAFDERWIDVFPNTGKISGAYSSGSAYDVHPYILMNFNGKFNDVSTLTHELGHTMQSYLSNKYQPFATAHYPIFTAEVASTFNEALLVKHQLKIMDDPKVKMNLLMNYLDGIRGTVFRQTQFAEFELEIHKIAETGIPLGDDVLTETYLNIARKYYGHDSGLCMIDDLYGTEWAFVPHFYYNFYVYQYATSFTASAALVEDVLSGADGALESYLKFLSAGGSDYPISLLKTAGVDMTGKVPFEKTMHLMNELMDQVEKMLGGEF